MSSPAAVSRLREDEGSVPGDVLQDTPQFDRLASVYCWMEWLSFGPCLSQCRRAFLSHLRRAKHALVLGDGDGRFTAALLRANRHVAVDAVDASRAMLERLRRRSGMDADRLRTEIRDIRMWSANPAEGFDVIVTHFFLDCLTTHEVLALAERVRRAARPDARWVVSEFAVPNGTFGRWVARPLVAILYWAFALMTGLRVRHLPDYSGALAAAGFRLEREQRRMMGLLVAQMWLRSEPRQLAGTAEDGPT